MTEESIVTVTNNPNPTIELEIISYTNDVNVGFSESIESAFAVHNTDAEAHYNILTEMKNGLEADISLKADATAIPTKTSQLLNDSNFAITSQIPTIPTALSSFTNDTNYVNSTQMSSSLSTRADTDLSNINKSNALLNLGFQRYDSGWFAVSANTTYTKTHGLGTSNIKYIVLIADNSSGTNQRPAVYFFVIGVGGYAWAPFGLNSTTISLHTYSTVGLSILGTDVTSGYYRILAEVV